LGGRSAISGLLGNLTHENAIIRKKIKGDAKNTPFLYNYLDFQKRCRRTKNRIFE